MSSAVGLLRQFNYSPMENLLIYGSYKPPEYDLSQISCPVALHYDKNDCLVDYKVLSVCINEFPSGKFSYWSHFGPGTNGMSTETEPVTSFWKTCVNMYAVR